ncbi:MAG TPA: PhoPQ-activated pathogenicity-related family protein [Bryobacteraceae bacterium]|nr:PhoPQ-activated pathogenicity-related family protein [Bryobacteraceae bacterium]
MAKDKSKSRVFRTLALTLLAVAVQASAAHKPTALDRYVAAPDPSYRYSLVSTLPGEGYTAYILDVTSQTWRSASEVDRPEWRHWLTIIRPDQVSGNTGLLFITGGANNSKPPSAPDAFLRSLAVDSKSVVAELRMIPNQPITFAGESKGRSEDSLIAYTWDKFLRGGDEGWPARLPMTKAAVRAMDTITAFCATPTGGQSTVSKFVVSGASKRGWTTWTTAAVDKRVVAIMPLVIDALRNEPSFDHHWRVYGFFSPAIADYIEMKIMDFAGTRRYAELMKIEDPYEYRERFTMPKFIINATGDQYFLPDSSQFYFSGLPGEKYLRYVPNTDHSLRNSDARESLSAYYQAILSGRARPEFSWKFEKDGSIRVRTRDTPSEVKLWQVTNPEARDFRLEKIGPVWQSAILTPDAKGDYLARVERPAKGFSAFLVELTYPGSAKYPLKFTTAVRVIPDTLPFPARKKNP